MEPGDPSVFQLLDPFCWLEDSIAEGDVKVGHPRIILDISIGGTLKYVFVVFDVIVKPMDLLFKAANFAGFLRVTLGDGVEEPFSDGLEDVRVEIRMGC